MWPQWCQCPLSAVRWLVVWTHSQCHSGPDLNDGFCARLASHTRWHCPVTPHQNKQWTTHSTQKRRDRSRDGKWLLTINYFLILVKYQLFHAAAAFHHCHMVKSEIVDPRYLSLSTQWLYYNMQTCIQAMLVVPPARQVDMDQLLSVPQSVYTTSRGFALSSITVLNLSTCWHNCLFFLCYFVTVSCFLSACCSVWVRVHLQTTLTRQINMQTNMLWVADLAFGLTTVYLCSNLLGT